MRVSHILILIVLTGACRAEVMPGKGRNSAAVAEVAAGRFTVANASWWGFDREDATAALQQAINSKASKVIVPFMGSPWIVRPIELRSHLELVFEPGVVVLARKGEFRERWDCLFSAITKSDITIRGSGTILRMRKRDYRNPPYPPKEEWKHVVKGEGVRRIMLEGLRMESSGGDGIYFGSDSVRGSEDIVIRNCVSCDNHRQGISLTDVKNLLVENCVFKGTEGTGPSAGVDYEPDRTEGKLVNCIFRNCLFEDNAGHGMFVRANDFRSDTSEPISIRFENCTSRMSQPGTGGDCGMCVRVPGDDGPFGTVEFISCITENSGQAGVSVYGLSVGNLKIRFVNCNLINSQGTAVVLNMQHPVATGEGCVEFLNCSVYEEKTGPAVQVINSEGSDFGDDVTGEITVHNNYGARIASEPRGVGVDLRLIEAATGTVSGNSNPAATAGGNVQAPDRRARDMPGYHDQSTFGDLWKTHELITDLPKIWSFRLDFRDEGRRRDWGGAVVDNTQWQPIKIGEWWEPQGHQYDGIAWYRIEFMLPAATKGKNLSLSFGAVDESATVYLNGTKIGEHDRGDRGWDQRFEIALGDAAAFGKTNIVAVRVHDRSGFGGIWKSVKLVSKNRD